MNLTVNYNKGEAAEEVEETRGITPDTALWLARYFNTKRWLLAESSVRLRFGDCARQALARY
jgi:plasmid maintenance system antidote protein VapI